MRIVGGLIIIALGALVAFPAIELLYLVWLHPDASIMVFGRRSSLGAACGFYLVPAAALAICGALVMAANHNAPPTEGS